MDQPISDSRSSDDSRAFKHLPGGYLEDGVSGERRVSVALQKKVASFQQSCTFLHKTECSSPTHLARIVSYEEELSVGREGIPLEVVPPLKRRLCEDEGFGKISLELQEHMGAWRYVSRPRRENVSLMSWNFLSERCRCLSCIKAPLSSRHRDRHIQVWVWKYFLRTLTTSQQHF